MFAYSVGNLAGLCRILSGLAGWVGIGRERVKRSRLVVHDYWLKREGFSKVLGCC